EESAATRHRECLGSSSHGLQHQKQKAVSSLIVTSIHNDERTIMKMLERMFALPLSLMAALMFASSAPALAAYPDQPIRMVVGFSPGGGVDVVGRIMAQALAEQLNTTVVVENKSGFSGNIAAQQVKQSAPDGYTLLMAPTTSYALVQTMLGSQQVGYDLVKDFKSAGTVGILPLVVIVNRS